MTFVALLRGINVGGKNKVPMQDLARVLHEAGLTNVRTYIASGNVLFDAQDRPTDSLAPLIGTAVERAFGVASPVLVKTGADVERIAAAIPEHWSNGSAMKADVVYLYPNVDSPAVLSRLPAADGVDHSIYVPGALLWMVSRFDATRSGLTRIMGTDLYRQVTVRNVNTARALASLVAARTR